MITAEAINERMAKLQDEHDKALANVNAFEGAILDCQYWLEQLNMVEPEPAEETESIE